MRSNRLLGPLLNNHALKPWLIHKRGTISHESGKRPHSRAAIPVRRRRRGDLDAVLYGLWPRFNGLRGTPDWDVMKQCIYDHRVNGSFKPEIARSDQRPSRNVSGDSETESSIANGT